MSPTSIEAHHQKWAALPAFPAWPYVMTDDDVEAWGDMLYMRGLVDTLADPAVRAGRRLTPPPASPEFAVDIYLEPWPADHAAHLLTAWRAA